MRKLRSSTRGATEWHFLDAHPTPIAKDQFIDALIDDELRIKIAQGRPATLRAALGVSLEIESFTLAAKRRTRYVRTIQGSAPEEDRSASVGTVTNAYNTVSENK